MSHETKNVHFYLKNLKLTINNTFNNVFCNRIVLWQRFLSLFKKLLDFHKAWLIFSSKIFPTTLLFSISKGKFLET